MWQELSSTLTLKKPDGTPVKKPTASGLSKFEAKHGLKLPASYREFIQIFGPGDLGAYFRIYAPGYPGTIADLDAFIEMIRDSEDIYIDTFGKKNAAFIRRMLPFSDTIGGDIIVWDPKTVSSGADHEYHVFMLPDDQETIVELAPDFKTFVLDTCLGPKFGKIVRDPNYQVVRQFMPFAR